MSEETKVKREMNKKLAIVVFIFLIILGGVVLSKFFTSKTAKLFSPLVEGGRIATNLWFPQSVVALGGENAPIVTAQAAYFIDVDSGEVLYEKNSHEKLPVASLTKIMTTIIALENKDFNDQINISPQAARMEPDHMLLQAGEKLSVEELLYGVFLVSANDAAEALAETSTSGREDFINQMNLKAAVLQMKDTLFINPSGLEEDGKAQYSSAFDVALMSRYAVKHFPHLVDISQTPHIILPKTDTHQDYDLYSGINLLTTYPGVVGFKTGYTPEAGLTLVTLAKKQNHMVLGVLLNSENRREEAKELLTYSFKKLGISTETF